MTEKGRPMELVFVVVDNQLDHYIDLFIRVKSATKKPATVTWYRNVLRYYQKATADIQPNWPPTITHCLAFLETFKGLKDYSRNNYYRGLHSWLNWLKKVGYIEQNPLDFLDPIPAPKPLPRAPQEEDVSALFAVIEKMAGAWHAVRDMALFSVALTTGARPVELAKMMIGDFIGQQIRVYSEKDKRDRELVLDDATFVSLAYWKKVRGELAPADLSHLWVSNYQGKGFRGLTYWGIYQRLKFWRNKADVEHFSPYALRHAFAIYSLRAGADLLDIRDQMGHASIKTTAIYTQVVNAGRLERHRKANPMKYLKENRETSF
jgi:integrase/recombinase XerD